MTTAPLRHAPFLAAGAVAFATLAAGCGRSDGTIHAPAGRPSLQRVLVAEEEGRGRFVATASKTYRAYLAHHPEDADAHLEMGILLFDALSEYPEAIFHFQAFLDARPGSEKAEMARAYIAEARKRLSGGKASRASSSAPAAGGSAMSAQELELVEHIEELNRFIASRNGEFAALSNRVATLERENARLGDDLARTQRRVDILRKGGDSTPTGRRPSPALKNRDLGGPVVSSAPTAPPSAANRRGTWQVRRGDSLWKIAQAVYGDASRNVDIRNANPGKIGPNDQLTEGDILICP